MAEVNISNDWPEKLYNFEIAPAVEDDTRLTNEARGVYHQLVRMQFLKMMASGENISLRTGLGRTTVTKAIKLLKETGWLTVNTVKSYNAEKQRIETKSEYILHWYPETAPKSQGKRIEEMAQEMREEYIQNLLDDFTCEEINNLMANK